MRGIILHATHSILLVTLLVLAPPDAGAAANVEPRAVGTWELMVPNAQGVARWIWEIRADGTYSFRSEGPGAAPAHHGKATFSKGQWTLQATTGLSGWTDGGTYHFPSPDTLAATGKLGLGAWQRSAGLPRGAASPWPATVVEMAAKARQMARAKLPDAQLLDIKIEPLPESFPRPPDGGEWSYRFFFWSPSTHDTYSITPHNPAGEAFTGGRHDLSAREPIPERFLEFAEAVKRAQAQGMRGKPARAALALNPKGRRDVVYDSAILSEGLTWTITPRDEARAYFVRATLTPATIADIREIEQRILSATLDPLPQGLAASKPGVATIRAPDRARGVESLVRINVEGPARIPKNATIEGDASHLKITGTVSFSIFRDRKTADREFARRIRQRSPGTHVGDARAVHRSCAFANTSMTCVALHPAMDILITTNTENVLGLDPEDQEREQARQEIDEPLLDAAVRLLDGVAATPLPQSKTPPATPDARGRDAMDEALKKGWEGFFKKR